MDGLHVDSVMKSFRNKKVLTDIYLSCQPGDIIGLLGRNGSGKSTLLKIIFGSLMADNKYIKIDSKVVSKPYENSNQVKYLPQDSYLPKDLTIEKIISLYDTEIGTSKLRNDPYINRFLKKRVRHLSGGEKRIIEILLIVYSSARYLLLDEPFNGVAPIYIDDIKSRIRGQSNTKGIILTDHDYRNIIDVSNRIILLSDGGIKEIKDLKELEYWGYVREAN